MPEDVQEKSQCWWGEGRRCVKAIVDVQRVGPSILLKPIRESGRRVDYAGMLAPVPSLSSLCL